MDNIIFEEIENILKEELSIADDVENTAEELLNKIIDNYKNVERKTIENGVWSYESSIYNNILNKKAYINYVIYNFIDNDTFMQYKDKYLITDGGSACLEGGRFIMIKINGYCISGKLNRELLLDTIMHEVEHVYQQIKAGKTLPCNDAYNKFSQPKYIYSNNELERIVSNLIYLTERFEIDGMVNGLYGELKEMGGEGISRYGLIKTYAYSKYKEVNLLYNKLNDFNRQEIIDILKSGNISYIQFIKRIEWGKKYFINKIGKVFFKYKKDMLKENNWRFNGRNGNCLIIF